MIDYADFQADEIRLPEAEPLVYIAMKKFRTAREIAQQGLFTLSNRAKRRSADVIAARLRGTQFWAHNYSARIEGVSFATCWA